MADLKERKRSRISVLRQLAALEQMSHEQLREKWLDLYGEEAPKYRKSFLMKRLAYRIQELFYGGLSEPAKGCLKRIAEHDPVATLNVPVPDARNPQDTFLPGTRFVRVWNDAQHEVIVRDSGFEYGGRMFRSLSAVAREITGTRWNGKIFFGLKGSSAPRKGAADAE